MGGQFGCCFGEVWERRTEKGEGYGVCLGCAGEMGEEEVGYVGAEWGLGGYSGDHDRFGWWRGHDNSECCGLLPDIGRKVCCL